jgi:RNA recognition motif-containing protein
MNIYVGNLSPEVKEEDLKEAFEAFGQVESVKIISDNYTGRSKGFGFIEMSNNSEAQSAIEGLNDKELKGRALKVNTARPRTENRGGRGGFLLKAEVERRSGKDRRVKNERRQGWVRVGKWCSIRLDGLRIAKFLKHPTPKESTDTGS